MKQERIVISKGAIRKGYTSTPTAEVVYITTDEKTGKKTSRTCHEVGAGEPAPVVEETSTTETK